MTDEERLKIIEQLEKVDENDNDYFINFLDEHDDIELLNLIVDNLKDCGSIEITRVRDMKVIKFLNDNDIKYYVFTENILFELEVLCYNLYRGNLKHLFNVIDNEEKRLEFNLIQEALELIEKYSVDVNIILSFVAVKYDISLETFLRLDEICRLEYKFQDRHGCRCPLISQQDVNVVKSMLEKEYKFQSNPFIYNSYHCNKRIKYDILKLYIDYYEMKSFVNPLLGYNFKDGRLQELITLCDEKYGKQLMRKDIRITNPSKSLMMICVNTSCDNKRFDETDEDENYVNDLTQLEILKNNISILKDNGFELTKKEREEINQMIPKFDEIEDQDKMSEDELKVLIMMKDIFIYISSIFNMKKDKQEKSPLHSLIFNKDLTLRQCRKLIKKYKDINIVSDGIKAIDFHCNNYKIINKILHHSYTSHKINQQCTQHMNSKCFKKYLRRNLIDIYEISKYIGKDLEKVKIIIKTRHDFTVENRDYISDEVFEYIVNQRMWWELNYKRFLEKYLDNEEKFFYIIKHKTPNLLINPVHNRDTQIKYANLRDYFLSKECHVNVRKYLEGL